MMACLDDLTSPLRPLGRRGALVIALFFALAAPARAESLKIGLASDPNILDPVLDRTLDGRIVFEAMCDKLVDLSPELEIVPQLAASWSWNADLTEITFKLRDGVLFQDGTKFDAAAVKYNLERDINFPGTNRKGELPRGRLQLLDRLDDAVQMSRLNLGSGDAGCLEVRDRLRQSPGLRRRFQIRRARGPGPHRARALRQILEQGSHQAR